MSTALSGPTKLTAPVSTTLSGPKKFMTGSCNNFHHSSRSFLTRSTIYNRNEKRRAKTLRNANDPRPGVVRLLAQLTGTTASCLPARNEGSSAVESQLDSTIFTTYMESRDASPMSSEPTTVNPPIAAVSAALGARVAELLTNSSMFYQSVKATAINPTHNATAPTLYGNSLAILPSLPVQEKGRWKPSTTQLRSFPIQYSKGTPLFSCSMAPFFVLFGTKVYMEKHFLSAFTPPQSQGQHNTPVVIASILSSSVAGATIGALSMFSQGITTRSFWKPLSNEANSAVLYFGSYELINGAMSNSTGNHQRQRNKMNWIVAAAAGALAGCLYETSRVYGTSRKMLLSPSSTRSVASPFAPHNIHTRLVSVVAHAAPTHALLFLVYEGAKSLLS